jgi:ribosomal protein S18 acetylase RimI-like enzyme
MNGDAMLHLHEELVTHLAEHGLQGMRKRYIDAPELQFGAIVNGQLVGFVCATRSNDDALTHASMEKHCNGGKSVCIHSVCVKASHRRTGIALRLLQDYLKEMRKLVPRATKVLLISKETVLPLYQKAGFVVNGLSAVVHGEDPWFECEVSLV